MIYRLVVSEAAKKQLSKLDKFQERIILRWLNKNIDGCSNPRVHGKGLTENLTGYWRYRIGDYRVVCEIHDDILEVLAVQVGHRSKIYS